MRKLLLLLSIYNDCILIINNNHYLSTKSRKYYGSDIN